MLTKVSRTMHEKGENFNKDTEKTGKTKKKSERKRTQTELKNSIEKLNRLDQVEESISKFKDWATEFIQRSRRKE